MLIERYSTVGQKIKVIQFFVQCLDKRAAFGEAGSRLSGIEFLFNGNNHDHILQLSF